MSDLAPIDAFISYRRSDGTAAARRIRQMLQTYRLPKALRAGRKPKLTAFLDTAYERGAADFYENTIRPALMAARWLVVVATPDAVKRAQGEDWISREVADFAAGLNSGNVVVVRAKGEFMAELPADIATRFPNVQIVDLRDPGWVGRLSPQRAARLADEKLKLVGPIYDIALEDMPRLRREEERRQVGRLGALAGALTATVVLVAGMSLFALKSQWDGSQALKQSLNAARESVKQLVGQYSNDEPLSSPTRDVVLQNCDIANRLRALAGAAPDPDQTLACVVEEQRALALAGHPEPGFATIAKAVTTAETTALKADRTDDGAIPVVLSTYRTWIQLDPKGEAETRYAAFQRRLGQYYLGLGKENPDLSDSRWRQAITALGEASETAYALGNQLAAAGKTDEAKAQYELALADAFDTDTALNELFKLAPTDQSLPAFWPTLADRVQQAAVGEASALSGSNPKGAAAALAKAYEYFSRPVDPALAPAYALASRRTSIAGAQLTLGGDPVPGAAMPKALWNCLENGHRVVSDKAVAEDDPERQQASDILNSCLDDAARITDARRAEVNNRWRAGNLSGAAVLMRTLIADSTRVDSLREFTWPWNDLYRAIANRDLAAIETQAGHVNGATAARAAAMTLFAPYSGNFDNIDDSAVHAALAKSAWQDVAAADAAARNGAGQ